MQHQIPYQTWEIPPERRRSRLQQTLDDLRFTGILFWEYLIGPFVGAPAPLTEGAKRIPVIIIPGFICRPALYRRLQQALHAAGYPVHVLDLGYQVHSVYRKAQLVSEYITSIGAKEVYAIGHSMGGLILTTAVYQGEIRIRHGWTLGAPLHGTNVIWILYAIAIYMLWDLFGSGVGWTLLFAAVFLSAGLRQMVPGSDLLRFISSRYDQMQSLTSVFCAMDAIAFGNPFKEPGSSSRFGRESDVLFPETGHNNIAMGDNAIRAIVEAVEARDESNEQRIAA
jgi:pimeloyl-ACP methyl ester carboxylesterase